MLRKYDEEDGGVKQESNNDRDKVNWMSSAQLWSDNSSTNTSSTASITIATATNAGNIASSRKNTNGAPFETADAEVPADLNGASVNKAALEAARMTALFLVLNFLSSGAVEGGVVEAALEAAGVLNVDKPNSPAARAVVDQVLRVVEKAESDDLLQPCITALGCLSRTFRATETRIIGPLVRLLDEREAYISREAVVALTKFACTENYLHFDHSKAIIAAGGPKHLVQLVYFGEQAVLQIEALVLLCYIALNVPDNEALAQAEALTVLEWASKQPFVAQKQEVEMLLAEAKGKLELTTGSRGFH